MTTIYDPKFIRQFENDKKVSDNVDKYMTVHYEPDYIKNIRFILSRISGKSLNAELTNLVNLNLKKSEQFEAFSDNICSYIEKAPSYAGLYCDVLIGYAARIGDSSIFLKNCVLKRCASHLMKEHDFMKRIPVSLKTDTDIEDYKLKNKDRYMSVCDFICVMYEKKYIDEQSVEGTITRLFEQNEKNKLGKVTYDELYVDYIFNFFLKLPKEFRKRNDDSMYGWLMSLNDMRHKLPQRYSFKIDDIFDLYDQKLVSKICY